MYLRKYILSIPNKQNIYKYRYSPNNYVYLDIFKFLNVSRT